MLKDINNSILENAPFGYAYHKIILNEKNKPINYKFLKVNKEFENLTGLNKKDIINQTAKEVFSEKQDISEWIDYYGDVALNAKEKEFEQYSEPLDKYYRIKVYSPKKLYFVTIFKDISTEIELAKASHRFLEHSDENIDYQTITDNLLGISKAKYIAFNKFEENSKNFRTMAISGMNKNIKKGLDILGFNLIGKEWQHDPRRAKMIAGQATTYFKNLHDLTGDVIPKKTIKALEKVFNLGQTILVKITKHGKMVGDFTIMMPKFQTLKHQHLIESYAQQVGLYLDRKKAERKQKESEEKYRLVVKSFQDGIVIIKNDKIEYGNDVFANMVDMDKENILKSEISEVFNKKGIDKLEELLSSQNAEDKNSKTFDTILNSDLIVRVHASIIHYQGQTSIFATIRDITKQKRIMEKLKQRADKTQNLDKFIPICAGCNKIKEKDKEGEVWVSPAEYITKRLPDINFSHGMCPECMKEYYPKYNQDEKEK